jgi:hypothetical protein
MQQKDIEWKVVKKSDVICGTIQVMVWREYGYPEHLYAGKTSTMEMAVVWFTYLLVPNIILSLCRVVIMAVSVCSVLCL